MTYTLKELVKETKNLVEHSTAFQVVERAVEIVGAPLIFSSCWRSADERTAQDYDAKKNRLYGITVGEMGLGGLVVAGTLMGFIPLSYLLVPLATNISSGLYECVRTAKKNLEKRCGED